MEQKKCAYCGAEFEPKHCLQRFCCPEHQKIWAKENMRLSGLENNFIRFIVDDCLKFVEREYRRGNKYDAIVMDPPSYGRGPNGEMWKLESELFSLVELCTKVLSDNPLFFLINSYTTGLQPQVMKNILEILGAEKTSDPCVYKIDDEETKDALVVVPDDQLSLAIGAKGQNVRLAAILTGWKIDIKTKTEIENTIVE